MSGSILDDHWLRQQPQNGSLSWTTSISRTWVSTVGGLELREASDTHAVHSLEALLSIVQQLKLKRLPATELEETRFIAAGETFSVSECRYQNRAVAVKHVRLQEDAAKSDERYTQRRLQAVLREVLIMSHQPLAQHPNIIDLLGYGWIVKNQRLWPFITVDFASEGSVRQYVKRESRPFLTLLILIGDIGEGLVALHSCGIVHGDLKADNVVVFPSLDRPSGSIAKLSDFGHSIIMSSPPNTRPHYFGTRLYNAPEVSRQKEHPIPLDQLHKCDIWAFGLCVWEILADGDLYFKKDWLSSAGQVSTSTSLSDRIRYSRTPNSPSALAGNQHPFERFDCSRLQPLALEFLRNRSMSTSHRPFLAPLLQKTLQVDPVQRISDLSRLPIVGFWSKSFSRDRLQSKLAGFALSEGIGYSMFSREDGRYLIWDQQEQLRQDFEAVALRQPTQKQGSDAAFQAMLCYINVFGASQNKTMAMEYLQKAEDSGHLVARIFGPRIRDGLLPDLSNGPRKYSECLAMGFRTRHDPGEISKIIMHNSDTATEFPNYTAFRAWLTFVLRRETQNLSEIEVTFNSSSHRHSMIEVAIQHDDIELVKQILPVLREQPSDSERMPPLVLAASRGNLPIVELLFESDTVMPRDNVNSILHWLFCFTGLDSHDLKHLVQRAGVDPASVNRVTTQNVALHSQWPFQVNGSPLATAIASGSTAAVEALLALGADPLSPAFEASDNEFTTHATPIHLAARFHYPKMLQAFWKAAFGKETLTLADARKNIALSNFPIACAIPLQTNAERYAIHGNKCMDSLRRTLELLPLELLEQRASNGRPAMIQAINLEDVDTVELLVDRFPRLARNRIVHPDTEGVYTYPLHFAVQNGSGSGTEEVVRTVQRILKLDPTAINRSDSSGIKPMHLAARGTSSSVAAFLLNEGASVHTTDGRGQTPLHFCRTASNVTFLLRNGAQIDQEDNQGFTAAHVAVSSGRETVLQALIDAGADLTRQRNGVGTPLHSATSRKSRIMVEMLLKGGSEVNALNNDGKGALQLALNASRSDLALLLFAHGADPFLPDGNGLVPFFTSLALEDPMVLVRFQEHEGFKAMSKGDIHDALHFAATHGRPAPLSQFLQAMSKRDIHEVLRSAATHGRSEPLNQLLRKIPRQLPLAVKLKGYHGGYQETPLHTAASVCRMDLIEVFLSAGMKTDTVDKHGNTPLLLACQAGHATAMFNPQDQIKVCQGLMETGADISLKNNVGSSPLSVAQDRENYPLMTLLLEHVLAINDDHPPERVLRILDSIRDPDSLERHTQRARALIGGVSLDWSLLKKAIVRMEIDFLMTVIGGFFLNRRDLGCLLQDAGLYAINADFYITNADQLCIYCARQDRSMVLHMLEGWTYSSVADRETLRTPSGVRNFFRDSLRGLYQETEAKRTGSGAVKENSGSFSEPLSRTKSKLGRWSKSKKEPVPNANIVPYPGT